MVKVLLKMMQKVSCKSLNLSKGRITVTILSSSRRDCQKGKLKKVLPQIIAFSGVKLSPTHHNIFSKDE